MQVSTCWTEGLDTGSALSCIQELALCCCERGGKVGSVLAALIRAHMFSSLCKFYLDPGNEAWDTREYYWCAQAQAFYKKAEWLDVGADRAESAYEQFLQSEVKCRAVNQALRALASGSANCCPDFARLIGRMQRKIRRVLGPVPMLGQLDLRFGPGATVSIRKRDACAQAKLAAAPECSTGLYVSPYLPELLREVPHWASAHEPWYSIDDDGYLVEHSDLVLTPGRLEFVPKNALTYRSIVVEPSLNGLLQAGIGDYISKRLKRVAGVDISDQTLNQRLALEGSITNELSTLDLSAASDSISYELVKWLVGEEWFLLLKGARTGSVTYKGKELRLEKFSSMGNGFTFPLETLIFWAATVSCFDTQADIDHVGVYGDDIICPRNGAGRVIRSLELLGFSVNQAKSFVAGPFRESCGADYRLGISVRPFFLKRQVSAATLFTMHNFFYRNGEDWICEKILKLIPESIRLYGPDGYGDGHLLSSKWERILSPKLEKKGYCGSKFASYTLKARRCFPRYAGDYISPLYSIYRKGGSNDGLHLPEASTGVEFSKGGWPLWPLPGNDGYKRIEIYTFV